MKTLLLLLSVFILYQKSYSQVIINYMSGQADTTAQAKLLLRMLKVKRDTLWYCNAPVHISSSEASFTVGFGISLFYNKAALRLYRETISGKSLFNNKKDGAKNGVWFTYTLFRRLKTAAEYDEGRLATLITFWANGRPKRVQRFNLAGRPVIGGGAEYEKE